MKHYSATQFLFLTIWRTVFYVLNVLGQVLFAKSLGNQVNRIMSRLNAKILRCLLSEKVVKIIATYELT